MAAVVATLSLLVALRSGSHARSTHPRPAVHMGLLEDGLQSAATAVASTVEGVKAAYEDESFVPRGYARAHHILFLSCEDDEVKAAALKARIEAGHFSFSDAAVSFSACPTRDLGGNLGTFSSLSRLAEGTLRGATLPYEGKDTAPFDEIVFSAATPLNQIQQVRSQWGVHLVLVSARGGEADAVGRAAQLVADALGSDAHSGKADGFSRPAGSRRSKARSKKRGKTK